MQPKIHPTAFIASGSRIYGDVEIGENASVWFNAVIRGDEGKVVIGKGTNVQDCCVIHSDRDLPVVIGDAVSIGHGSVVRSATIGNRVMVGMNSTVMTGVEIGSESIVGAQSMVPYNKKFPPRSMIYGVPARHAGEINEEHLTIIQQAVDLYLENAKRYQSGLYKSHADDE